MPVEWLELYLGMIESLRAEESIYAIRELDAGMASMTGNKGARTRIIGSIQQSMRSLDPAPRRKMTYEDIAALGIGVKFVKKTTPEVPVNE